MRSMLRSLWRVLRHTFDRRVTVIEGSGFFAAERNGIVQHTQRDRLNETEATLCASNGQRVCTDASSSKRVLSAQEHESRPGQRANEVSHIDN